MRCVTSLAVVLLSTACFSQRSVAQAPDINLPDVVVDTGNAPVPAGPLTPGHSFGQTFVAEHNGLSEVEAMVATYAAKLPAGELVMHLCHYPNIQKEIASVTVPASSINDNSYVTLTFPPIPDSGAHTYYLYLETRNIPSNYAITVWRSSGNVYSGGQFFLDGHPRDSDIRFRSFYHARAAAGINGVLVSCKEDGRLYLAQKGRLRLILDSAWLAPHGYAERQPISLSMSEIHRFPAGPCLVYLPPGTLITIGVYTVVLFLFLFFAIYNDTLLKELWSRASASLNLLWSGYYKFVLLAAFVALMCARAPWMLTHPRFWAEEGTAWFQYASAHSLTRDIVYIYPAAGYLNLMTNIGAIFSAATARFLDLEYAPLSTTITALLVQVAAIALILFGKSRLFTSPARAIAGCLIVLFAPTSVPEVWFNTLHSVVYLGLIALLLLFEKVCEWPASFKWGTRIILVLCGLSAAYSVALLPLFILVFFLRKERERKIQCYVLAACLFIQIGCVIFSKFAGGGLPNRGSGVAADTSTINVLFWQIMVPTLGRTFALIVFGALGFTKAWMTASFFPHFSDPSVPIAGLVCFLIILAIFFLLLTYGRSFNKLLLTGAFFTLAILTCLSSLRSIPSGRYAVIPGIIVLFLLLANIQPGARARSLISMIVLAFALSNGIVNYSVAADPGAPKWPVEVAKWKANHNYQLKVEPSFWTPRVTYHHRK